MEQLGSHCPDFDESRYLSFLKSVEEIKVSLKPDKNNGSLSWRPIHSFDNTYLALILLTMGNVSDESCRENKKHFMSNKVFFSENSTVYNVSWGTVVGIATRY
jgi:hypothetical protein